MAYYSGWGWMRRESGVESLVEWIDRMQRRSPNQRWGIWGGVVGGSSGLVGGWLGVALGALHLGPDNPLLWAPIALWCAAMGAFTLWTAKRSRSEDGAWSREARGVMRRLLIARWHGSLKQTLGQEVAFRLNDAASVLLRCQATLDSPAWKAAAGSETWNSARDKALRAMDSAMARMLLLTASGNPSQESEEILKDMRAMDEEVTRAAKRHSSVSGIPLEGAEGLRQALTEMRELASADEEFLQQRLEP